APRSLALRPDRPRARIDGPPLCLRPCDHGGPMAQDDTFEGTLSWHGQSTGRAFTYETIDRATRLEFPGGAAIEASAPSQFMGDDSRANPETLMLGSLMQCHFLTFMAVAAKSGATVVSYTDSATGTLGRKDDGKTGFVSATLRPRVEL